MPTPERDRQACSLRNDCAKIEKVASVGVLPWLLSLALFSQATRDIERAFFQNNADLLRSVLSSRQGLNISLPEPLSFSDRVSAEQTYFIFRKIFSSHTTFEFFVDRESTPLTGGKSGLFKSRWSFKNNRNNDQYVFLIFFYLMEGTDKQNVAWKIVEIKAQKL